MNRPFALLCSIGTPCDRQKIGISKKTVTYTRCPHELTGLLFDGGNSEEGTIEREKNKGVEEDDDKDCNLEEETKEEEKTACILKKLPNGFLKTKHLT